MCSRIEDLPSAKAVAALTALFGPFGWRTDGRQGLKPTDQVRLVRALDGSYEAPLARWGLVPDGMGVAELKKYAMFNARLETLESSRAFSSAFRTRRCVLPLSAFFEWPSWDGKKRKVRITRPDGLPLLAAGLWNRSTDGGESCTLVTRVPTLDLEHVHDRMPALLLSRDLDAWLRGSATQAKEVAGTSWPPGALQIQPV